MIRPEGRPSGSWPIPHALVTLIVVTVATLTSCSVFDPEPTPAPPASLPSSDQPRSGGVYRIATPYDAITLDPARANSAEDWWLVGTALFNRLYSYDQNARLFPDLAEDFPEISPDGLTYIIHLRQGVTFHNGRELTADDVKFTLERVLWPETASWGVEPLLNISGADAVISGESKALTGVVVLDPYTLQITLNRPLAAFTALLSMSPFSIVPRDEVIEAGEAWGNDAVIGTGPFKLAEWTPGEHMRLTRHGDYFRADLPYLDGVTIAFNVVAPVALERWQNGEVDFAWISQTADEAAQLHEEAYRPYLRTGPSLISSRVLFNLANQYAGNVRVRQAVMSAINTVALAEQANFAESAAGLLPPRPRLPE
jgi:ABC-type transport system substrate-binding protein